MRPFIAGACITVILTAPICAQSSNAPPQDTAAFRYLIGEWNVITHRRGDGSAEPASGETLRFTPAPAGVGLVSYWRMNRGSVTHPEMTDAVYILGYDRPSARWSFYFLSDRSAQFYDGKYDDNIWHFYREYLTPAGVRMLQRQSWRRISATKVRRMIEDSPDSGATWVFVYEGVLDRAK